MPTEYRPKLLTRRERNMLLRTAAISAALVFLFMLLLYSAHP